VCDQRRNYGLSPLPTALAFLIYRLLQRRIGLCGDATRAPSGAWQTADRAAAYGGPACPCRSQFKAKNPPPSVMLAAMKNRN